jgi:hypothetical protein
MLPLVDEQHTLPPMPLRPSRCVRQEGRGVYVATKKALPQANLPRSLLWSPRRVLRLPLRRNPVRSLSSFMHTSIRRSAAPDQPAGADLPVQRERDWKKRRQQPPQPKWRVCLKALSTFSTN